MAKTISDAIRELCLRFPDTEEVLSHGHANFKVAGRVFATFTINHHGDGRVALNVCSPPGAQQLHTETEPEYYFVPPYVGPKGWLGIELNQGLDWDTIARHMRLAWERIAPATLVQSLAETPSIEPPDMEMTAQDINPLLRPRAMELLIKLKCLCDEFPETSETLQFGNPTWKAGRKSFVSCHCYGGRVCLQFWVGVDQQTMLTYDNRYRIPAYMGHNGWIDLDVQEHADWGEIECLLENSYRHFALKRMLRQLDES